MFQLNKILLLEDSIPDQVYIKRCLLKAKVFATLIICENKDIFIRELRVSDPDMILLDYDVPGFYINEAYRLAKKFNKDVPVIYVTGNISKDLVNETLISEADAYVLKEYLEELPDVINSIWLHKMVNKEKDLLDELNSKVVAVDKKLISLMKNKGIYIDRLKDKFDI
ncbi:response regulator [Chondrinema litorale]|uniref:response regulator n=1 Tax=Chondrinema litorale TaxID=2994555 RepID=UPI002543B567|nr:response regulator [Chondrinema litorale]UZR97894.1 response regulator [Chondrinema litorale]